MLRPLSSLRALLRRAGIPESHHGPPISRPALRSRFTTSPAANLKQLPPRPKHPPESEIEESFLKGSGPGGQKINKTSSAVQLKHIPTGLVVKSQATRSRTQNRKIARDLLALKLDAIANGDQSRTAVVGDVKRKRAASKAKKSRRKYRKLVDAGAGAGSEGEGQQVEEGREQGGEEEEGEEWEVVEETEEGEVETEAERAQDPETERVQPIEVDNTKKDK
ncbi:RF-1 domain-containing protein [Parachaetomium inaequale]|uniref:RF-1 domain-containing protein n=1 Tax=Parachaetomium inaequale TaxID=2588326 RepID=A0AAN6PLN7_9PEZI|nr:RF-1 domain-containing protein [Parachaetomium inaequale]